MVEEYTRRFAKLRTDASPARWSAATRHRAPHKPFLLLSIIDLVAQGVIQTNWVELNADLIDLFDLYWSKVLGQDKPGNPVFPFYHLHSDGFWHLVPVAGMGSALSAVGQIRTFKQLRQLVLGARFDDELFEILLDPAGRDGLRRVLVEGYFAPDAQAKVVEVIQISAQSFQYTLELMKRPHKRFKLEEVPGVEERYYAESRSTAFRRVVVDAYNHTCAICGIRIVTPEGRTAVLAAHIVPWNVSHNDDPRNGIALCGLHHWAFDQGLVGVLPTLEIQVSPVVSSTDAGTQAVWLLSGRTLHRPADRVLWPATRALDWHMREIFRAKAPSRLL